MTAFGVLFFFCFLNLLFIVVHVLVLYLHHSLLLSPSSSSSCVPPTQSQIMPSCSLIIIDTHTHTYTHTTSIAHSSSSRSEALREFPHLPWHVNWFCHLLGLVYATTLLTFLVTGSCTAFISAELQLTPGFPSVLLMYILLSASSILQELQNSLFKSLYNLLYFLISNAFPPLSPHTPLS